MLKEKENNSPLFISQNLEKENILNSNKSVSISKQLEFTKKYNIEELNIFRDDILKYFKENFQSYSSQLHVYLLRISQIEKNFEKTTKILNSNYNNIIGSQANINTELDKLKNYESFCNKTNDKLISHEIRINNIREDFSKATQKYDKIYLDNLELPGYIGRCAKYKNCQFFFNDIIKELSSLNQYKEKNILDLKSYKEKLENIIKSINILVDNNNQSQMKYINKLNQKNILDCQNMIDMYGERIRDIKVENAKYSIDIINKSNELSKKWEKVEEIKDEIFNKFDSKSEEYRKINDNLLNKFNEFKNEYKLIRNKFFELADFIKDIRFRKNVKYIFGEILKKKDIKNIHKSLNDINAKKMKDNESSNINSERNLELLKDISVVKKLDFKISNILGQNMDVSGEINTKEINEYIKRNKNNFKKSVEYRSPFLFSKNSSSFNGKNEKISLFKNSNRNIELNNKNNLTSEYKKNVDIYNSNNKYKNLEKEEIKNENISIENNTKKKGSQKIIIDSKEETNIKEIKDTKEIKDIKDIKTFEEKNNSNERTIINCMSSKNKTNIKKFNIGIKDSNSVMVDSQSTFANINNSNTILSNDNNISFSSVSTFCINDNNSNNKNIMLKDMHLDANDKVIKELASELEQSTAKKDLTSTKKEEQFKMTKSAIEPLNLIKAIKEEKEVPDSSSLREKIDILLANTYRENIIETNSKTERNNNHNYNLNKLINENENKNNKINFNTINNNTFNSTINNNDENDNSELIMYGNNPIAIDKKFLMTDKKISDLEEYTKEKLIEIISYIDKLKIFHNHINNHNKKNNNVIMSIKELKEKNSFNSYRGMFGSKNNNKIKNNASNNISSAKPNLFKSLNSKNDENNNKNNFISFEKKRNLFNLTFHNFYKNNLYNFDTPNKKNFNYSCKKLKTCSNINNFENHFNSIKEKDYIKKNILNQNENKKWDINILNKIKNNNLKKINYRNNSSGNIYLTQKRGEGHSYNETDVKLVYLNKLVNDDLPYSSYNAFSGEESFNL